MEDLFYKLTKLQRTLIVVAVCLLLLVGFYFLFISDIRDEIAGLEQQLSKLKIEIDNQERIRQQGPRLKKQIEGLRDRLKTMVASLPEKQDIESLLKDITNLLSESRLENSRFVPGQEQINEDLYYAMIPISMNVKGDYQKQGAFLSALNELPRIVNVPSIRLSKAGPSAREKNLVSALDVVLLEGTISGVTYRRLTQDEIKNIAQKKAGAKRR
jgi:type IV pilus assembly protein PilO